MTIKQKLGNFLEKFAIMRKKILKKFLRKKQLRKFGLGKNNKKNY